MTYQEAVDHLYALTPELAGSNRKFDLDHMRLLMQALGDPQNRVPAILIAGTNGKGSTAATLAAILTAAGYRTGLYTSPHLSRVNERIQLARPQMPSEYGSTAAHGTEGPLALTPIADADFARLYTQVDQAGQHLTDTAQLPQSPSFFERLTAVAFLHYAGPTPTARESSPFDPRPSSSFDPQPLSSFDEVGGSASLLSFRSEAEESASALAPPPPTPAEILILEIGLGGRLDATNIVTPLFAILTDIALDHQEYLGTTIAEIAREKCGILRENGTVITLSQHPQANQAIGEAAAALNVRGLNAADYLPPSQRNDPTEPGPKPDLSSFDKVGGSASPLPNISTELDALHSQLQTAPNSKLKNQPAPSSQLKAAPDSQLTNPIPRNRYTLPTPEGLLQIDSPLPGAHQQRNIALAITAAMELRKQYRYNIPNPAIEAGIRNTQWPGRLEFVWINDWPNILLDVAHNPAGAWTLRSAISQLPEAMPRTLVFSCLRDKSLEEMSRILFPLFDSSAQFGRGGDPLRAKDHILLAPIASPRATDVHDLAAAAHALDIPAHAAPHLAAALHQAQIITPPGGLIVITGSVYLVGEARQLLLEQK